MKTDIRNRTDIETLINSFYERVRTDETIGYLFDDVAKVDWPHHLPIMYSFWEQILFHTGGYKGNPMPVHVRLHEQSPLKPEHFNRWLSLFKQNADELFEGDVTEQAKQRAESIATVMRIKVLHGNAGLPVNHR